MIPALGHVTLLLAMLASATQIFSWRKVCAKTVFALLSFSFAALIYVHVTDDFSVLNVVENSHSTKPLIYKIAGVWGNHEGSMLLWVWMLSFWGFLLARGKRVPEVAMGVQGAIGFGFLLFILFTSNPLMRVLPAPVDGAGFNPILEDLGLAIHPPLLYAGYVGFSVAFCLAMAALAEGKIDQTTARLLRPWVLAAWSALTFGITSGAVWAYYELGWGGYWFWDPVENASLMPWLAGTALLHSVAVLEKRGSLGNWTVFLAILAFSFSLLGTFLVRSGVLTSVHAFASDPARGVFILALLVVAIGGAFLFYGLRAFKVAPGAPFETISRESLMLLNNVFLFAFCATVFMGTLYPVFMSALKLGSVSVGTPYYTATLLPLLIPFAALMGAAPAIGWGQGTVRHLSPPLYALLAVLLALLFTSQKPMVMLAFSMGGWIIFATLYDFWKKLKSRPALSYYGMVAAHVGFGLMILGSAAMSFWTEEKTLWISPGEQMQIAHHTVSFREVALSEGSNYQAVLGLFSSDGAPLVAEKRWYPVRAQMTSEVALKVYGSDILYLVMGDQDPVHEQRWVLRAYYHPRALWLLLGALMVAAGGVLALFDKRRRAA